MSPLPVAASTLLADLLASSFSLVEVVRTPVSVHYTAGPAVLCVALPTAVRLPLSLLSPVLPASGTVPTFAVRRWWTPPRPTSPSRPRGPLALDPAALVGRGPGLTPSGDDVLAG